MTTPTDKRCPVCGALLPVREAENCAFAACPVDMLDGTLKAAPSASAPCEVWEVWGRTSSYLFATEQAADDFIASGSASVIGGLVKSQRPVLGVQSHVGRRPHFYCEKACLFMDECEAPEQCKKAPSSTRRMGWARVFPDGRYEVFHDKPRTREAWDTEEWNVVPLYAEPPSATRRSEDSNAG